MLNFALEFKGDVEVLTVSDFDTYLVNFKVYPNEIFMPDSVNSEFNFNDVG